MSRLHEEHRSPGTVMRDMVEQFVDAACRTALGGQRLVTGRGRRGLEQAWVLALTASDPVVVHADTGALHVLAKEVDAWHRTGERTAPLRAAFRLAPPTIVDDPPAEQDADANAGTGPADALPWRLEFALQATDDPSLLVAAADIWGSERTLRFLDRALEAPEERLLADLGRASRLYPELDRALDTARPEALELQLDEVLEFLRDTAPLLEQAGFGVLLPDELRRPVRLGARLKTTARSASGPAGEPSGLLGYEGILDYRWEIAVGDHSLSAEELLELVRLKTPLVRLRGRWVELGEEDLTAALRLLEDRPTGQMTVAQAARIGLGVTDPGIGLELAGVDADGALGALLDGDADQRLEALATPDGLHGTLRAYQERGLSWLAFLDAVGLGGCLADDMGLGKSIQLLALLVHERGGISRRAKRWPAPTLLVCPMSIVGNWAREAARFAPDLRILVHHGRERLAGDAFAKAARRSDLVITTYSLAARDRDDLAATGWRRIVLDEAQNIKNPAAKQTRAIRTLDAPQRLALTGTPVENRLSELWSIMDFCNPGLPGTQTAFREAFAVPIEKLRDDEAAARLRRLTRPFVCDGRRPTGRSRRTFPTRSSSTRAATSPASRRASTARSSRTCSPRSRRRRASSGAAWCCRRCCDSNRWATIRRTCWPTARGSPAAPASSTGSMSSSTKSSPRARRRWCSRSSPSVAAASRHICVNGSAVRSSTSTEASRGPTATVWSRRSRTRTDLACSCCRSRPAGWD